jgi:hypothetical protein
MTLRCCTLFLLVQNPDKMAKAQVGGKHVQVKDDPALLLVHIVSAGAEPGQMEAQVLLEIYLCNCVCLLYVMCMGGCTRGLCGMAFTTST